MHAVGYNNGVSESKETLLLKSVKFYCAVIKKKKKSLETRIAS